MTWLARILVVVIFAVSVLGSGDARAYPYRHPSYVANPSWTGMPPNQHLLACETCHVSSGGGFACGFNFCFNPFGYAYRSDANGWNGIWWQDADADGRSNSTELGSTLPGFPQGAQSVSCDMATCASGGSAACSSNVRCTSTRSYDVGRGTSHYTFGFSCVPGTSGSLFATDASWVGDCANINECSPNPCGIGGCSERSLVGWTSPGYDCSCPAGTTNNGSTCVVTNDCVANVDDCVAVATCFDTAGVGNFTCTCPVGYSGNGRASGTGCTDVNECAGNPCGANGTCMQIPIGSWASPGYTCNCAPGYGFDGATCVLANECTSNLDDCVAVATCNDPGAGVGDFTCTCPSPAYTGDGRASGTGCTNVDECATNIVTCTDHATCVDLEGSYDCVCDAGYHPEGPLCVDDDECMAAGACPVGETCQNTDGSFECLCPLGQSHPVGGGACAVRCGDGTRGAGEACDDGDLDAGDGCSPTCTVEAGWFCMGPVPGPASVCSTTCGDELIDPPETCDDGPLRNSDVTPDACRTTCVLPYCGDGVTDTGERCDRGGVAPGDADPSACTVEGCARPLDAGVDGGTGSSGGGCAMASPGDGRGGVFALFVLALSCVRARRRRHG